MTEILGAHQTHVRDDMAIQIDPLYRIMGVLENQTQTLLNTEQRMLHLETLIERQIPILEQASHNAYHGLLRVTEQARTLEEHTRTLERLHDGQQALPNIMDLIRGDILVQNERLDRTRATLNDQADTLGNMNEIIQAIDTRIGELGHQEFNGPPIPGLAPQAPNSQYEDFPPPSAHQDRQ